MRHFVVSLSVVVLIALLSIGGCGDNGGGGGNEQPTPSASPAPTPTPTPQPTPTAEPSPTPTPTPPIEEVNCEGGDPVMGGLLYDKWWTVNGADEPDDTNPTYPVETNPNMRTGSQTWRCKECHGWDYLGVDGFYGSGSHFTGIIGVFEAMVLSDTTLFNILRDGTDGDTGVMTGYSEAQLSDMDVCDLVEFIQNETVDLMDFVDFDTKAAIAPDLANGMTLYNGSCIFCHGVDGQALDIDDAGLRELADANPVEFVHKIRFGQPDTLMPSSIDVGWTDQEVIDVLGYAQTLPLVVP